MRNSAVAIKDKAGTLLDSKTVAAFFASARAPGANNLTDPYVVFDPDSKRFFFANSDRVNNPGCGLGSCVAHILLAVSKTSTPASLGPSDWYFYAFDRTIDRVPSGPVVTANWGDFDRISVTRDAVIISMNVFRFSDRSPQGVKVRILDKTLLISGQPIPTWTDLIGLPNGTQASVTFGSPATAFLVLETPCHYRLFGVSSVLTSSPVLIGRDLSLPPPCRNAPNAVQPEGAPPLDVVQPPSPAVHRSGRLWLARPVGEDFGSGDVSAVRWTEIDVSGWPDNVSVLQKGTLGFDGAWHFAPAVMVDRNNNMMLLYARSSSSEFASAYFAGRLAGDPQGALRTGGLLKAGTAAYSRILDERNRYTDYFGTAADPSTDSIWMLGMFASGPDRSGTWVGQVAPQLTLAVSVSQSTFSVGQTLSTTVEVSNPGLAASADIYLGTLRPDGAIEFLTGSGIAVGSVANLASFRPVVVGLSLATPFSVTVPNLSSHFWTSGDLHGSYVFFLLLLKAGALADGTITNDEILAVATASYSFP